jgi:hypothetical protein
MSNNLQAELARPQPQKIARAKCSTAAFPKVFMFRELQSQVPPVPGNHNVMPPRTVAPPPCLPLYIINLLEVDEAAMHLHPSAQPT